MRTAIGKFLAIVALGLTTTIYGGVALAGSRAERAGSTAAAEQRVDEAVPTREVLVVGVARAIDATDAGPLAPGERGAS